MPDEFVGKPPVKFASRVKLGPVCAPQRDAIQISDEKIIWRVGRPTESGEMLSLREIEPDSQLFTRFMKLHSADDKQLLDFARNYGVLGLCEHGLPMFHPSGQRKEARSAYLE